MQFSKPEKAVIIKALCLHFRGIMAFGGLVFLCTGAIEYYLTRVYSTFTSAVSADGESKAISMLVVLPKHILRGF